MIVLKKSQYNKIVPLLNQIPFNTLFAKSVLIGNIKGKVFANDKEFLNSILIKHPYGMSLLLGDSDNEEIIPFLKNYLFNKDKTRNKHEWLQVYPESWYNKLKKILQSELIQNELNIDYTDSIKSEEDNKVMEFQRINYKFNKSKYLTHIPQVKNSVFLI